MQNKILVISDSHGCIDLLKHVIRQELPFGYLFFCGDGLSDLLYCEIPKEVEMYSVVGNVDKYRNTNGEEELYAGVLGKLFMIVHGDNFGVKTSLIKLKKQAEENHIDVVVFGHTHQQKYLNNDDIVFFNPGALRCGEYGVIEVSDNKWKYLHKSIS